ncbi:Separin [Schistosoma japonicum]|nr:Separin [Schistosoma japonicum]
MVNYTESPAGFESGLFMCSLSGFFSELSRCTALLQSVVPNVRDVDRFESTPNFTSEFLESEEVYAGLPTVLNSKCITKQLENCLKALEGIPKHSDQSVRQMLTRIELLGVLASCQKFFDLESSIWKVMFTISDNCGRFLDASYALINCCLSKIFAYEQNSSVYDTLKSVRTDILSVLQNSREILESSHEACLTGRLPTPHAHFQSVIVSLGRAYIEHYCNWHRFSANLDLIRLEHKEFFEGKSWAVVCARGYFYWFHLHARCIFGANFGSTSMPLQSEIQYKFPSPPVSPLHASVIVRMHGQTLVKFMRLCCERKLQNNSYARNQNVVTGIGKENEDPKTLKNSVNLKSAPSDIDASTAAWTSAALTDNELLNLWLGTRLLLYGCHQTAELYTLLGTVREARVYQNELLCIGQRFHICSYTQIALNLMAHLDMFAQRQWAFELRLRQLNHIATCQVSLEELVNKKSKQKCTQNSKVTSNSKASSEADESAFIHSKAFPNESLYNNCGNDRMVKDITEVNSLSHDAFSDGSNPLLSSYNRPFNSMFSGSPTRRTCLDGKSRMVEVYPSPIQVASVIAGHQLTSEWNGWYNKGFYIPSADDCVFESVSRSFLSVGGLPLGTCVCLVLNGAPWPWLFNLTQFVRSDLLPVPHYLPALYTVPSKDVKLVSKVCNYPESKENNDLIEALSLLNTTPAEKSSEAYNDKVVKLSSPQLHSRNDLRTGKQLLLPAPRPNAPRRPADFLKKTNLSSSQCNGSRSRSSRHQYMNKNIENDEISLKPVIQAGRCYNTAMNKDSHEADKEILLQLLGYPSRKSTSPKSLGIYSYGCSKNKRKGVRNTDLEKVHTTILDPVESCSSLIGAPLRPRSVRLTSKWAANQIKATSSRVLYGDSILSENNDQMSQVANDLAIRLYDAYQQLSGFPVPNLLRPICQWLGIYWLGKCNQPLAGRFLSQSIGIGPTTLYLSILSSRMIHLKSSDSQSSVSDCKKESTWFPVLKRVTSVCAPNHCLAENITETYACENSTCDSSSLPTVQVIQICLVDELGCRSSKLIDETDDIYDHTISPYGLGARSGGYLVVSRYTGISGQSLEAFHVESRVIHGFAHSGFKYINSFNEIQMESLDSMVIEDRANYWRTRYNLNERLENLLIEIRREWFTDDDLDWLFCREKYHPKGGLQEGPNSPVVVIIPDRQLIYLPWEWILWDRDPESYMPTLTRSFSLPLVIGHLATQCMLSWNIDSNNSPNTLQMIPPYSFNPEHAFYVLNPESNLPSTQQTFEPVFHSLSTWTGVTGRIPTVEEVNNGFTKHDLLIFLGHGNGSQFLLHTFNQGLSARSVALILGCSSGKPRWVGRHEPYTSLFNHLIAGCPFVCGLLWDVTDRDVDRFTLDFLMKWLGKNISDNPYSAKSRGTLGQTLFLCDICM